MDAVGIVEALNTEFESRGCKKGVYFILHKKISANSTMKAYKEYDYTLWYINDGKKYQATRIVHTARVVTEKEEEHITNYMEEAILMRIFSILQDNINLKSMLDGSFTGYGI